MWNFQTAGELIARNWNVTQKCGSNVANHVHKKHLPKKVSWTPKMRISIMNQTRGSKPQFSGSKWCTFWTVWCSHKFSSPKASGGPRKKECSRRACRVCPSLSRANLGCNRNFHLKKTKLFSPIKLHVVWDLVAVKSQPHELSPAKKWLVKNNKRARFVISSVRTSSHPPSSWRNQTVSTEIEPRLQHPKLQIVNH